MASQPKAKFVFHGAFDSGVSTFDDVQVLSVEGERVKVRFVGADQRKIDLVLYKDAVRGLVDWRQLF